MNTNFHTESRMREICTYGSMRGRTCPMRGVSLYSTDLLREASEYSGFRASIRPDAQML